MGKIFLLTILLLLVSGCSMFNSFELPPAEKLPGFLTNRQALKPNRDRAPFLALWVDNKKLFEEEWSRHENVFVSPVDISFLISEDGEKPDPDDVQEVADYLRAKFKEELLEEENLPFKVVDQPGPKTFLVELALICLDSTVVAANIAKDVAGFFIPGSQVVSSAISVTGGAAVHEISKGKICIAMRFRDSESGEVLGEFYDERSDRSALLVNVGDYSRFGNAKINIDDWASEFAELMSTPQNQKVSGPSDLAIVVW